MDLGDAARRQAREETRPGGEVSLHDQRDTVFEQLVDEHAEQFEDRATEPLRGAAGRHAQRATECFLDRVLGE